MFENKSGILLIGGLGFFLFAFLSNAVVPILIYRHLPEQTAEQLVTQNVFYQLDDLRLRYPEQFEKHVGEASEKNAADLLLLGDHVYVG